MGVYAGLEMSSLSIPLRRCAPSTIQHPTLTVTLYPQKWKDAGSGRGIIRSDDSEPPRIDLTPKEPEINNENHIHKHIEPFQTSSVASALAHHYSGHAKHSNFFKRLKERFTTDGITDRRLRKTVAKDTWLYTAVSGFPMRTSTGLIGVM